MKVTYYDDGSATTYPYTVVGGTLTSGTVKTFSMSTSNIIQGLQLPLNSGTYEFDITSSPNSGACIVATDFSATKYYLLTSTAPPTQHIKIITGSLAIEVYVNNVLKKRIFKASNSYFYILCKKNSTQRTIEFDNFIQY